MKSIDRRQLDLEGSTSGGAQSRRLRSRHSLGEEYLPELEAWPSASQDARPYRVPEERTYRVASAPVLAKPAARREAVRILLSRTKPQARRAGNLAKSPPHGAELDKLMAQLHDRMEANSQVSDVVMCAIIAAWATIRAARIAQRTAILVTITTILGGGIFGLLRPLISAPEDSTPQRPAPQGSTGQPSQSPNHSGDDSLNGKSLGVAKKSSYSGTTMEDETGGKKVEP